MIVVEERRTGRVPFQIGSSWDLGDLSFQVLIRIDPMKFVLLSLPFYRGSKRLTSLPKVMQLVKGRGQLITGLSSP